MLIFCSRSRGFGGAVAMPTAEAERRSALPKVVVFDLDNCCWCPESVVALARTIQVRRICSSSVDTLAVQFWLYQCDFSKYFTVQEPTLRAFSGTLRCTRCPLGHLTPTTQSRRAAQPATGATNDPDVVEKNGIASI